MKKLFGLIILAPVLMLASTANAQVVYDAFPDPFPGSAFSQPYAAQQVDEFGDHVSLAGSDRSLSTVDIVLTSWTCENDPPGAPTNSGEPEEPCETTPGSSYTHPITLNLYAVDNSGANPAVGGLVATKTVTATVPFRPSWDSDMCPGPLDDIPFGGTWYDSVLGFCVHGFNFVVSFDFGGMGITLPDELIYGIAFNTNLYGENPVSAPGGYDSLNVAVTSFLAPGLPSIGTNVEPDTAFIDYGHAPFYCDGGTAGTDVFRRDAGCWGIATPFVLITVDVDTDSDGVNDGDDLCPATAIPEGVPLRVLKPNRWALTDGGFDFDTVRRGQGQGPNRSYTTEDTAGCSCEQIIENQGLGNGHTKFGCSISAMDDWVDAANMP